MRIEDIRSSLVEEPNLDRYRRRDGWSGAGNGTPAGAMPRDACVRGDTDEAITGVRRLSRGDALFSLITRRLEV